jgi:hypothetical protein
MRISYFMGAYVRGAYGCIDVIIWLNFFMYFFVDILNCIGGM